MEEKQRQLEERGVAVEKALRGEAGIHQNLVCFLMFSYEVLVQQSIIGWILEANGPFDPRNRIQCESDLPFLLSF